MIRALRIVVLIVGRGMLCIVMLIVGRGVLCIRVGLSVDIWGGWRSGISVLELLSVHILRGRCYYFCILELCILERLSVHALRKRCGYISVFGFLFAFGWLYARGQFGNFFFVGVKVHIKGNSALEAGGEFRISRLLGALSQALLL